MIEQVCKACLYFEPKGSDGICRRYPPTTAGSAFGWPFVQKYDWCGEYQKKEQRANTYVTVAEAERYMTNKRVLKAECPGCGGPAEQCFEIAKDLGFGCANTPLADYYE